MTRTLAGALLAALAAGGAASLEAADPLPSWNEGPARRSVVAFVENVTREGGPGYVPPAERIAVFDNDGTLWCEKPMYIQLDFILRKLAARAESDPSLRSHQPWQAAWEKDFAWLGGAITKHYIDQPGEWSSTCR